MHKKKISIGIGLLIIIAAVGFYTLLPPPALTVTEAGTIKIASDAPFRFTFSQRMNKKSVEAAFQIYPSLAGRFFWPDAYSLEYLPETPMEIGASYQVLIDREARSLYGKKLKGGYTLSYTLTGPPFVFFAHPHFGKNTDPPVVEPSQPITVMFDRPMRQEGDQKHFLKIDPPAAGKFRWLAASAFQFIPDHWAGGATYTFTVPAGLRALNGGEIKTDFTWAVQTPLPRVISVFPESEDRMGTNDETRLTFNQAVDLAMVAPGTNALLFPSNDLDSKNKLQKDGFFNTEVRYGKDEKGKEQKNVLIFKPTFPYLPDTNYRFVLKAGLKSLETNEAKMKEDFVLKFHTNSSLVSSEKPDREAMLEIKGGQALDITLRYRNLKSFKITVCPIFQEEFIRVNGRFGWPAYRCKEGKSMEQPLEAKGNTEETLALSLDKMLKIPPGEGLYFMEAEGKPLDDSLKPARFHQPLIVSETQLYFSRFEKEILVFGVDRKTGQGVPDLALAFLSREGEILGKGKTDVNGIFKGSSFPGGVMIVATKENPQKRWGFFDESWEAGPLPPPPESDEKTGLYLNRQNVEPGESLIFYGFSKIPDHENRPLSLSAAVEDAAGNKALIPEILTGRTGVFWGQTALPLFLKPGRYQLKVKNREKGEINLVRPFLARAPGKPALSMEALDPASFYSLGQPISLSYKVAWSTGLIPEKIHGNWRLWYKGPLLSFWNEADHRLYFKGQEEPSCFFKNCLTEPLLIAENELSLNDKGIGVISLSPADFPLKPGFYRLELEAEAGEGAFDTETTEFQIIKGREPLALSPERYWLKRGEELKVYFSPEASSSLWEQENPKINVVLKKTGAKDAEESPVFQKTISLNRESFSSVSFSTQGLAGLYWITAEGEGTKIPIYVLNENAPEEGLEKDFIIPDRPFYQAGGKASLLWVSQKQSPALSPLMIHYKKEGMPEVQMIESGNGGKTAEILLKEAMTPHLPVHAVHFKETDFQDQEIKLKVLPREKDIQLELKENREEGVVEIKVYDGQRRPLSAELLGLWRSRDGTDEFEEAISALADPEGKAALAFKGLPQNQNAKVEVLAFYGEGSFGRGRLEIQKVDLGLKPPLPLTESPSKIGFKKHLAFRGLIADEFSQTFRLLSGFLKSTLRLTVRAGSYPEALLPLSSETPKDLLGTLKVLAENNKDLDPVKALLPFEVSEGGFSLWSGYSAEKTADLLATAYALKMISGIEENISETSEGALSSRAQSRDPSRLRIDNHDFKKSAMDFLWRALQEKENLSSDEKAFLLWALSEAGAFDTEATLRLFYDRKELSLQAQALLVLNLEEIIQAGQKSVQPFRERLLPEILSEINLKENRIYLKNTHLTPSSLRRTIAALILTLSRLEPGSSLLDPLIKEMSSLNPSPDPLSDLWEIWALQEYRKTHELLTASYDFSVLLNNQELIRQSVNSDDDLFLKTWPLNEVQGQDGEEIAFALKKEGVGPLFFRTELNYQVSSPDLPEESNNLLLSRRLFDENGKALESLSTLQADSLYTAEWILVVPEKSRGIALEGTMPAGMRLLKLAPEWSDLALNQIQAKEEALKSGATVFSNPLWHFSGIDAKPNSLRLMADTLPAGVYTIRFIVEAKDAGRFQIPPVRAYSLFDPAVFAQTKEEVIEIQN